MIKYWFTVMMVFGVASSAFGADYHYKVYKTDKQVIHVVKLNPKQYQAALVKAQAGRETVASIANRKKAQLAINGGFFDMGEGTKDGAPTGSLVINGKAYKIKNKTQALAILHSGQLSINLSNPKHYLQSHTGADYSLVSGIPMLINEGKIVEGLAQKKGDFYVKSHARTAMGILPNKEIILCVVEHRYMKNLNKISMDEAHSFLKRKAVLLSEIYNKKGQIKIEDFKKIFKGEFKAKEGIQGLSIIELATFLKKLGCEFAINLDGGGSSTLWIDGTVVNSTIGDKDEAKGMSIVRPVSDAVIFTKKSIH